MTPPDGPDSNTEASVRAWIRDALTERYGDALLEMILAGSRAKGTNREDSDWDVIAVVEGFRSIWPFGPIRMGDKLLAPDGNPVEVFEVNPDDLQHPLAKQNRLVREALAQKISIASRKA